MKPYLTLLLICGGMLAAHAENQTVLMNVKTASGFSSLEVTTDTRITFSEDQSQMIVAEGDMAGVRSFNVDDIVNISFTVDSTSLLEDESLDEIKISHNGKILTITYGGTIEYALWDLSGSLVTSGTGSEEVSIDFNQLKSGVYIIKANQSTLKYINH